MRETGLRRYEDSAAGAFRTRPHDEALDDWLGDVSDEDWSEDAAERVERRRAVPAYRELPVPADDFRPEATVSRRAPARPGDPAEARRADVERRRLVAGVVLVMVLGFAVAIPALLLRDGGETEAPPTVAEPVVTTPVPSESDRSSTPTTTTPETGSSTTTTPSTTDVSTFTLPEGTKLRRGEGDPALVTALQQALSSAGYDPGSADGTFGEKTEAAVVAFQQDNDLSADGVVGPETAAALNGQESTPDASASAFALPEGTKLRRGEGDPALVTALQQALSSAGYNPGSADGTFGEDTEAAVVAFQQDNDLSADGVVGPETASALNSALATG